MHIPDGYLGPQTYTSLYGVMIFIWHRASVKVKQSLSKKNIPLLALASAFSFVIMMFNVPVPGGSSAHAIGSAIVAIVLGPWAAIISISTTIIVQALLFGDGGVTAIAANSFTMAVIPSFSAYYVFRFLSGKYTKFGLRQKISAALAGYIAVNLGALVTAIFLGIQPIISVSSNGQPLYAPYPLSVTVPAMTIEHLLFFGLVEGAITSLVCTYLAKKTDVFEQAAIYKSARNKRSLDAI